MIEGLKALQLAYRTLIALAVGLIVFVVTTSRDDGLYQQAFKDLDIMLDGLAHLKQVREKELELAGNEIEIEVKKAKILVSKTSPAYTECRMSGKPIMECMKLAPKLDPEIIDRINSVSIRIRHRYGGVVIEEPSFSYKSTIDDIRAHIEGLSRNEITKYRSSRSSREALGQAFRSSNGME